MKKKKDSDCPINFSLEIFGDQWSLLIIRDIMLKEKSYYSDFLNSDEKISTNILANRLGLLEEADIIGKIKDPENSAKYIYYMTKKGIDLLPVLLELIRWGATYDPETGAPKEFIRKLKNDRQGLITEITKSLKKPASK